MPDLPTIAENDYSAAAMICIPYGTGEMAIMMEALRYSLILCFAIFLLLFFCLKDTARCGEASSPHDVIGVVIVGENKRPRQMA